MVAREAAGGAAFGLYVWRVADPKGSYAAFYDASNWLTGWVVSGDGMAAVFRNVVNLVLVDQADGFLLGMAFFALMSAIFWPIRAGGRWCGRTPRHARLPDARTSAPRLSPAPARWRPRPAIRASCVSKVEPHAWTRSPA